MIVFIKTLTGLTVTLDVEPSDSIATLKKKISERESVPVPQQRLLFAGKELVDDKSIEACGIKKETILHLVLKKKEENLAKLSKFEQIELKEAQSEKLASFYNASAGLNDEVAQYRDEKSTFDKFSNPSGDGFDLGRDGSFTDYTVLIGNHAGISVASPLAALKKKGFNVVEKRSEAEFLAELDKADVAWIVSGADARNAPRDYVERVLKFHHSLGGLLIMGDNEPLFAHANLLLAKMFPDTRCISSDPGDKCMKIGSAKENGTFITHLITSGIVSLYEGVTICYTDNKACPLKTLGMNSTGHAAIQFADHEILKSEDYGRVVLDHGWTKLYYKWDDAGTARYVINATVWLLGLEHKTRIGVPITARAKTKNPLERRLFAAESLNLQAPTLSELVQRLPQKLTTENPVRVSFLKQKEKKDSETTELRTDRKIEWSKSKSTNQRRPITELAAWLSSKDSGHFYLYIL